MTAIFGHYHPSFCLYEAFVFVRNGPQQSTGLAKRKTEGQALAQQVDSLR